MEDRIKKLIPGIIVCAFVIFGVFNLFFPVKSLSDVWSYIGYAISIDSILVIFYSMFLWRLNPFEKLPRLKKYYKGEIHSNYKKAPNDGKKEIVVEIIQTLFSTRVITRTDINNSVSVYGTVVEENGQQVLYYTYLTNPNASTIKKNPIQYGTCRFVISDSKKIQGRYWTNIETSGDIILTACKKNDAVL